MNGVAFRKGFFNEVLAKTGLEKSEALLLLMKMKSFRFAKPFSSQHLRFTSGAYVYMYAGLWDVWATVKLPEHPAVVVTLRSQEVIETSPRSPEDV